MPNFQTKTIGPQGVLVYGNQGSLAGPIQVVNLSTSVVMWVGNTSNISTDGSNSIPLLPQASVSFDGSVSIYAITATGTGSLAIIPSGISYSPGAITASITAQGTLTADAFNVAAAQTFTVLNLADVTAYSSYEISVYLYNTLQNTIGASLTAPVILTWYDDLISGIPVFTEEWDIWIANTRGIAGTLPAFGVAYGSGAMHGKYLTVQIAEEGGINGFTCRFVNIYGSTRAETRPNWRQQPPQMSSNGATEILSNVATTFNNVLGSTSNAVTLANTIMWIPFGLYSGSAFLDFQATAVPTNNVCFAIAEPRALQSGGIVAGAAQPVRMVNVTADTNDHEFMVQLPRAPSYLVVKTAALANFTYSLIAQELS